MKHDTIFFDIGNTLFFYNYEFLSGLLEERFDTDIHPIQLEETHRKAQRELVEEGLANLGHEAIWNKTYERWLGHAGLDEALVKRVIEAIRKHPFNHLFWTRMDEGVPEMLDWFSQRGFKLGIISNAEGQIRRLIEYVGIDSKFDAIIDSGDVGVEKPNEGIFRFALEALRSEPERSIHVGDIYDIDIVGARSAGITPVLIERNYDAGSRDCISVAKAADLPSLDLFKGL